MCAVGQVPNTVADPGGLNCPFRYLIINPSSAARHKSGSKSCSGVSADRLVGTRLS